MKKVLIATIAVSFMCWNAPLFSQANYIGPMIGVNLANVNVSPEPQGFSFATRTGFIAGGALMIYLNPNLSLLVEPAYIQKGSKITIEEGNEKVEATMKANTLDIPVLLKLGLGQGSAQPYLIAGPTLGFKLGDAKLVLDKATVDGQDVTNLIPEDEKEEKLDTKSTEFGVSFGAGVMFPVGNNQLFIEGVYNLGLTNMAEPADSDDITDVKTNGIQFKAGILFSLGG
jgi:hypothetical protein